MAGFLDSLQNAFGGGGTPTPTEPFANYNFLEKFGLGLGGIDAVNATEKQAVDVMNREALKKIAAKMQTGELDEHGALLEYARQTGDYTKMFNADTTPAAIREYSFVNKLDPQSRALYFQNKRANQLIDTGGAQVIASPEGKTVRQFDKTLAPAELPTTKAEQAAATATGTAAGTAAAAAPGKTADADFMLKSIDDVLNDEKGLNAATGGVGGLTGRQAAMFPLGEDQRRIQPKIDQLKGQAFLQAYNNLKGAGQITEIEGEKATNAIGRFNQAQDPKDFKAALTDLRDVVTAAKARNAKAPTVGMPGDTPAAPDLLPPPGMLLPPVDPKSAAKGKVINFGDL